MKHLIVTVAWWQCGCVAVWRVCFINNVKWPAFLFWRVFTVIMIISMLLSCPILESSRVERCQLGREARKKQVGRARHMVTFLLWLNAQVKLFLDITGGHWPGPSQLRNLTNFGVACQVFIKTGARVWERGNPALGLWLLAGWSRYQDRELELVLSSVSPPALRCQPGPIERVNSKISWQNTRHSASYWIQTTTAKYTDWRRLRLR